MFSIPMATSCRWLDRYKGLGRGVKSYGGSMAAFVGAVVKWVHTAFQWLRGMPLRGDARSCLLPAS